jgi:polysaccharide biosynthesis protein PslH
LKILAVSGRAPARGGRGDQNRLFGLLNELSSRHEVTVVAAEPAPAGYEGITAARTVVVEPSKPARGLSALGAVLRGQPGQTGWMMPTRTWRHALDIAADADVVLVVTSRSLRGPVPAPLVIDHVDSMSFNMANRARGPESALRRAAARFEAWRLSAWERRIAAWAQAQVATSGEVAELLPGSPPVTVIPAAWDGPGFEDVPDRERDIDVVFTGDMSYPPNTAAARALAEEILPLVRRVRDCSAWIVGRHADALSLPGVHTAANVPDLHAYLRRAKVAVAPVLGRGSPFKTLEAAACGAALVAAPWSVNCYGLDAQLAETAEEFAAGIVTLLEDGPLRTEQAARARKAVERHRADRIAARFERVFDDVTSGVRSQRLV